MDLELQVAQLQLELEHAQSSAIGKRTDDMHLTTQTEVNQRTSDIQLLLSEVYQNGQQENPTAHTPTGLHTEVAQWLGKLQLSHSFKNPKR